MTPMLSSRTALVIAATLGAAFGAPTWAWAALLVLAFLPPSEGR